MILDRIGLHVILPSESFETTPGRTSISWPSCTRQQAPTSQLPSVHCPPGNATHPQDTLQQTATGDSTLEVLHLRSGLVDVERANDDQFRARLEVADGDGDLVDDVLDEGVDVVPQLGRDRDDRRRVGDSALDKGEDRLVVLVRGCFPDQVHLVLQGKDAGQQDRKSVV